MSTGKTYAVMNGNVVENIIFSPDLDVVMTDPAKYIEYTDANPAYIGGTYDPVAKTFAPPVV